MVEEAVRRQNLQSETLLKTPPELPPDSAPSPGFLPGPGPGPGRERNGEKGPDLQVGGEGGAGRTPGGEGALQNGGGLGPPVLRDHELKPSLILGVHHVLVMTVRGENEMMSDLG